VPPHTLYLAYLDESGSVAPFREGDRFLTVAVTVSSHRTLRTCERIIRRIRRQARLAPGIELKAISATDRQLADLLSAIAKTDIEIVAVIVDKRGVRQPPDDAEDWYRQAVARACRHCIGRWPAIRFSLDKRYSSPSLRARLEEAIWRDLGEHKPTVTIEHLDSHVSAGLQVVDFVAWAISRKYQWEHTGYYDLIRCRIVEEDVIEAK
jgi:hypothetical protein